MEQSTDEEIYVVKRSGSLGAVVLIIVGGLFLLQNFGLLDSNFWNVVWRFWPLLFIMWGLNLLWPGRRAGSFIILLLIFLILGVLLIQGVHPEWLPLWMHGAHYATGY